jgi:hypothetical protein
MSESAKFFLQTLLAPLTIAVVGFYINSTLHEKQEKFDRLKLSEQILANAFDGDNPYKALALTKLMPSVIEDKAFADSIAVIITSYYFERAKVAAQNGNDSAFNLIVDAATTFSSQTISVSDSIDANPVTSKAKQALAYEQKGFQQLQEGNLDAAKTNFDKANKVYPTFHSTYEISKLIEKKQDELDGSNKTQIHQQIIDSISLNYSWKAPAQFQKKAH